MNKKQLASCLLVFCCRISGCWFLGSGLLFGWALGLATFLAAWFLAAGFPGYLLDNMLLGDLLLGHLSDHLTETGAFRCPSAFGLLQACVLHSSLEGQCSRDLTAFSSGPMEKFIMMYSNMSWRNEPPLSFKLGMAYLTFSFYFGGGASFRLNVR